AHLVDVVESLPGIDIDIETNGTRAPLDTDRIRRYVVSPKLANSGVRRDHRIKLDRLAQLAVAGLERTAFKFVVYDTNDLDEVDQLVLEAGLENVWIMPAGTTRQEILDGAVRIADAV